MVLSACFGLLIVSLLVLLGALVQARGTSGGRRTYAAFSQFFFSFAVFCFVLAWTRLSEQGNATSFCAVLGIAFAFGSYLTFRVAVGLDDLPTDPPGRAGGDW